MRRRLAWAAGLAVMAVLSPALTAPSTARSTGHGRTRAALLRPRPFSSCRQLVGYARRHFAITHGVPDPPPRPLDPPRPATPSSASGPAPAAARGPDQSGSPTFSTTNNQEAGVDEPDTAKTDGRTIYTVAQGKLFAVTGAGTPRLAGSLDLGSAGYSAQLLLRGARLIVISGGAPFPALGAPVRGGPPGRAVMSPYYLTRSRTQITEVDVTRPAQMRVSRTMTVDGTFVDARQNGASARLVISSAPHAIDAPGTRARPAGWIPRRRFASALTGRSYVRPVSPCTEVRRPVQFSGLGMLTILTVDLDRGLWASDSKSLLADAQIVYGSTRSLYVATQRWLNPALRADRLPRDQRTVIDRFDVGSPRSTTFVGSGEVPGYLLNQFSLSEQNGYLRVASTSRPIWWFETPAASQSYVTVLAPRGPVLAQVGQVAGLGVGQQIRSVRFVGNSGYVVTFRQVDPLYTLDLSSPTAPRVAGQLELRGYSAYLHPLGSGRLLGVGEDVSPTGTEPSGAQLELFDVSHPATPRLLARRTLGDGSSTSVAFDHHAFLYWPPTRLAVLPVQIYSSAQGKPGTSPPPGGPASPGGGSGSATTGTVSSTPAPGPPASGRASRAAATSSDFVGAIGYRLDGAGISEVGRISHDDGSYPAAIDRSVVIGDHLFTISSSGVMASALATLAREGFVAFPTPYPAARPQPAPGPAPAR